MLAPQVVPRVMCLAVDQMKKLLQKVTFVKSNKLSFQLLKLIGFLNNELIEFLFYWGP